MKNSIPLRALAVMEKPMNDPRKHRLVKSVEGQYIFYNCGCVNEIHHLTQTLRRLETCEEHRKQKRSPEFLGQTYYEDLHAIENGIPQCPRYLRELEEALGPFPIMGWGSDHKFGDGRALEIGPGASMYCPAILKAGYDYMAIEPSEWASGWTRGAFDVPVITADFEDYVFVQRFRLILAAHSLEHMIDAPKAIGKCADLLAKGGELWIVIPDDSDPVNPDHVWFFNMSNLTEILENSGLIVKHSEIRRIVKHESFMYITAIKGT